MRMLRAAITAVLMVSGSVTTVLAPTPAIAVPTIAITVTNTGTRAISGLYLSLYTDRGWGPDQLNGMALTSGGSVAVSNVACITSSIVAIAEDEAGCFLYRTVSCDGDAAWTITNSTTRDCGR